MKFTVSTKPLADSLNLAIINANVSKFYRKSCLAQVSVHQNTLTINAEAARILSEVRLKGANDTPDASATVFVDSLLLKQLVSTFETSTTTLELTESGLVLYSGKSKFTLPKLVDGDELSLDSPQIPEITETSIPVDKSDWKFVKDNQMYALSMSFTKPVYTRVWVSESGDVLVGDFDNSLFTHSKKSKLGTTCVLADTIINLFNSLPDGAKLVKTGKSYLIMVNADGFAYVSQLTPEYEEDEGIGSYNSDIILNMMEHPKSGVKVPTAAINKFLSQADLLKTSTEDVVKFGVAGQSVIIKDNNVDCKIEVEAHDCPDFLIEFKADQLKSVVAHYSEEFIQFYPVATEEGYAGVSVWSDNCSTTLAAVDEQSE